MAVGADGKACCRWDATARPSQLGWPAVSGSDGLASGLVWQNIGPSRPNYGRERSNAALAQALQTSTTFDEIEWKQLGISDLRMDDFIKSVESYFRPVDGLGACFSRIGSDLCGVTYSDKQYVLDTDKSSVYGSTLVQQETDQLLNLQYYLL